MPSFLDGWRHTFLATGDVSTVIPLWGFVTPLSSISQATGLLRRVAGQQRSVLAKTIPVRQRYVGYKYLGIYLGHMPREEKTEKIPLPHGVTLEVSYSEPRGTTVHLPDGQTREFDGVYNGKYGAALAQLLRMEEEERRNSQEVSAPVRADEDQVDPFDISVPLWVALRGKPTIAAYLRSQEGFWERHIADMMGVSRLTVSEYLRRVKKGEE